MVWLVTASAMIFSYLGSYVEASDLDNETSSSISRVARTLAYQIQELVSSDVATSNHCSSRSSASVDD